MSLSTLAGLMSLVLGVLLLGLRRNYRDRIPGLLLWGTALLMFTAGTAAYLVNPLFPLNLGTLPGNALVQFGFALLMCGSQRFLGRPVRWWPLLLVCLCSLSVIGWFLFAAPDYRMRITAFTWTLAIIALAHMVLLLRHGSGWTARFTAGVLLCLSVLMAGRGLVTWWVDKPDTAIYMPSPVQGAYLATFAFAVLLLGVGVLFMATERVRQEFEFLASHDGLTHALTRRSWMAAAQAALAARARPVAVLMLDVDHFKRINDAHGHQAGDHVLASLAGIMAQALPDDGALGRYGGEEFIVLLAGRSATQARAVAEELRLAIAARSDLGCTVSIGLTTTGSGEASLDALIRRADEALYQAKRQGRNRVVEAAGGEGAVVQALPAARPALTRVGS